MKFIVGLGNPGLKYAATRHNVGFEVVERFAYDHGLKIDTKKFKAYIGQGVVAGEKVILVKPQTYMNLSGESVRELLDFYKADRDSLIVVYDDIDLDVGQIRIRTKGSAGGHNGIKNIISHLGSNEFVRVKVGVGNKPPGWDLANYVLGRFDENEMDTVVKTVEQASKAVNKIIEAGELEAMNIYNVKKRS
jgi:PTH1 family peptidyl-tRNA hydrolase